MDPSTLAAAAVDILAPFLAKAGEGAAEKIGENAVDTAGKLFRWLRGKPGARFQTALDDLVAKPADPVNRDDLRTQLTKALQTDPILAAELAALLPAGASATDTMIQNVSGAGAKAAQVKGSGNTTNIS